MQELAHSGAPRLKVLIVGDGDSQLEVVRATFAGHGHLLVGAAGMHDGPISAAMVPALFSEHRPDVVVIDLQSASGGGYQTVQAVRSMEDPRWIPIWVLGRADAPAEEQALALESGADVFLRRPVSLPLLKANLAQLTRYMGRQRQFVRRRKYLEDYFEATEDEIRTARVIMDRLLRTQNDHSGVMQSWIAPAIKFSGDAMVAERSPDGSLKLLLADGVGHGLSAALNVLPVCRAFQSMAQKGFGLSAMVIELNHTIRRDLPSHRFVAATLVSVDAAAGCIEVWNGGNPACFMIDALGDVIDAWSSDHLPLGVVDSDEIDARPVSRPLRADGQLMLYSDGAVEALDERGQAFGEAALLQALAGAPPAVRLEALKFAVVEHLAGRAASDDVTLALLDCGAEFRLAGSCVLAPDKAMTISQRMLELGGAWEMSLTVDASRLKHLDMVPVLQEFASRIDPLWSQGEAAFTQLSESYGQALEQGLLKLEAGLKARPEGLNAYAQARDRKLQDLQAEAVRITLARGLAGQPLQIGMHEAAAAVDPELDPELGSGTGPDTPAAASFARAQAADFSANYGGMDVATARPGSLKPH